MQRSDPVTFDFEGSLRLARLLYDLSLRVDQLRIARLSHAQEALVDWSGAVATEFAQRLASEASTCATLAVALRDEADGWATEWCKAIDEDNYNRYQDACDRVRGRRNLLERGWGLVAGHDDLPPQPQLARRPTAPAYAATRGHANYSNY